MGKRPPVNIYPKEQRKVKFTYSKTIQFWINRSMHALLATASLIIWYDILWWLFLSWYSGVDTFLYTASFSHKMSVDLSIGTPNILSLYRNAAISSTQFFTAVNSDPNVNVSTPFCLLLCHIIGDLLQNISIHIMDILVVLSPAWLASAK